MPKRYEGVYHAVEFLPIYRKARRVFMDWIAEYSPKGKGIDAGAGEGLMTREWLRRFPKMDVHGIDLSPVMLQKALANGLPPARMHLSDMRALRMRKRKVPSGSQNFILAHSSFHFIPERPEKFFAEAARTLKRGGYLAMTVSRPESQEYAEHFYRYLSRHLAIAARKGKITRGEASAFVEGNRVIGRGGSLRRYSAEELVQLAANHGFEAVEVRGAYAVPAPKRARALFTQVLFRKRAKN